MHTMVTNQLKGLRLQLKSNIGLIYPWQHNIGGCKGIKTMIVLSFPQQVQKQEELSFDYHPAKLQQVSCPYTFHTKICRLLE